MSTVIFILACGILCLVVMSKIPGLEHLVKPLINLAFTGVQVGAASGSYWAIWLTKLLLASHTDLIRHLFLSAEAIDPSMAVRDNEA